MEIHKMIRGFVVQTFDTKTGKCSHQCFVPDHNSRIEYQDEFRDTIPFDKVLEEFHSVPFAEISLPEKISDDSCRRCVFRTGEESKRVNSMKIKSFDSNPDVVFDATKPVHLTFFGVDGKGFIMGFMQKTPNGGFYSGVFSPLIRPLEWKDGNIFFGEKTEAKFIKAFEKATGQTPTLLKLNTPLRKIG
jgi:hypothetical protein